MALMPAGIVARPAEIPPELWRKTLGLQRREAASGDEWGVETGQAYGEEKI